MKLLTILVIISNFFFISVSASDSVEDRIREEIGIEKAVETVPNSLRSKTDINFSPSNTPATNGMNVSDIFKFIFNAVFESVGEEIKFILSVIAVLIIAAIAKGFSQGYGKNGLDAALHLGVSLVTCSLLIVHINSSLDIARSYTEELSVFIKGLLPFIGSMSLINGEISTSAVTQALILSAVTFLQTLLLEIAIPISKVILSFSVVGYISKVPLGALSEFLTGFTTKLITLSFGILCAVIYFQNTVSTVTDSLALRSVKLAAGSFIPIVGGFVSEASGTLISGVRLVKSTFGIFAICVLLYMTAVPLVDFAVRRVSLKFLNVVAKFISSDSEAKVIGELWGVYNILSAIMIASSCFFIFALSVFIKSEVG